MNSLLLIILLRTTECKIYLLKNKRYGRQRENVNNETIAVFFIFFCKRKMNQQKNNPAVCCTGSFIYFCLGFVEINTFYQGKKSCFICLLIKNKKVHKPEELDVQMKLSRAIEILTE